MDRGARLLAVGGTHVLGKVAGCRLERVEPAGALKDLAWKEGLAFEALGEGSGEAVCGAEKHAFRLVAPARLELELEEPPGAAGIPLAQRFRVRPRLRDGRGRELEVGELTGVEWTSTAEVETANQRPAGEFGAGDTLFGRQAFRAVKPGTATIDARLGALRASLAVKLGP